MCSRGNNDLGEPKMIKIEWRDMTQYSGYIFAICAAAIYGLMAVLGKMITTEFASPMIVSGYLYMLGAGCASAFGVSCWYLALSKAPVVLVAPIIAINPLVTIVLSFLFLKRLEQLTKRTIYGAVCVVFGIILISVGSIY